MKLKLDQVQPDGQGFVAYINLVDDKDAVIARTSVHYDGDMDKFEDAVMDKIFDKAIENLKIAEQKTLIEENIRIALDKIDVTAKLTELSKE